MYRTSLDRVFDPLFDYRGLEDFFNTWPERSHSYPTAYAWKDDEKVTVELEIPGFDPKEVEISVKATTLTVSGERKGLELEDKDHYHHHERWHGKFQRSFELPFEVEADKVEAKYLNGILTVTLARAESDKPHRIEITHN